ncbi:HAMP domain-containing sensor histidine kinase [Pseudovibrio exalbescens]|uniref:sensor histidine kinase n=1 Tax=Pseudovibrio exalbescens TaxID=197461 RepID=UPI0023668BB7|nr:HAMP domain-containing sensor histidine kinase [Pseudovibrio exalbescens]MDD7910119.1 HAMP domain-containing sensor histidine kinase [Pseudovibrio exalbescens]
MQDLKKNSNTGEAQQGAERPSGRRTGFGLSSKLLVLTILFVMISEVLIFVPSIANYRNNWLQDNLAVAGVAASLIEDAGSVSESVQHELLEATGALAISYSHDGMRRLIAMSEKPDGFAATIRMEQETPWSAIACSFETLLGLKAGNIRVIGDVRMGAGQVDMVIPVAKMRADLLAYSLNILQLSLVISIITATLVYSSLRWLFLRPMQRLTSSMDRFARDPENKGEIISPSNRADEIGEAERQLAAMETKLNQALKQQRKLADLGLAVSKINHDLRNILSSAQLFIERLEGLPDPTVQRIAPKLLATLDRATSYTKAVMSYGKAQEAEPNIRVIRLADVVSDVEEVLGLSGNDDICFESHISEDLEVNADPEQIFRVIMNLCRNAVQAMQEDKTVDASVIKRITVDAEVRGDRIELLISDTGPGVPEKMRENLFRAFHTSGKAGGTGLGLAIAAEIVKAHQGTLSLKEDGCPGACFVISLPHREQPKKRGTITRLFPKDTQISAGGD